MKNFQIFKYIFLDPIKEGRYALGLLRLTQTLHDKTRGRSDKLFRYLGAMIKPKIPLPQSSLMNNKSIITSCEALRRRGWDILPYRMSEYDIAELKKFAFSTPAYAGDPTQSIPISPDKIPADHGRYIWKISDLFKQLVIQKMIAECPLHDIAQRYIGCRPIMTHLSLWLDPVYNKKFDAHIYHHDNDGPAFLKFFIYLTNVDIDSGAHSYIEGSQRMNKPAFLSRSQRYEKKDLLDYYGEDKEIIFSAGAGTIIAEDTSGFHKGTTPKKSYRLLLEIQYAMFDIPHIEETYPSFKKVLIPDLDPAIKRICKKFVT